MSRHSVVIVAHVRAHLMARASMLGLGCLLLLLLLLRRRLEGGTALFGHLHYLRWRTPGSGTPVSKCLGSAVPLWARVAVVARGRGACRRRVVAGLGGGHAIDRAIGQHAAALLLLLLLLVRAEMVIVVAWRWSKLWLARDSLWRHVDAGGEWSVSLVLMRHCGAHGVGLGLCGVATVPQTLQFI